MFIFSKVNQHLNINDSNLLSPVLGRALLEVVLILTLKDLQVDLCLTDVSRAMDRLSNSLYMWYTYTVCTVENSRVFIYCNGGI